VWAYQGGCTLRTGPSIKRAQTGGIASPFRLVRYFGTKVRVRALISRFEVDGTSFYIPSTGGGLCSDRP
jgi:hypothetical protein